MTDAMFGLIILRYMVCIIINKCSRAKKDTVL